MHDPNQPGLISETLLKKRRSLEELALRRAERLGTEVKKRRVVRGENVKIIRPELLVRRKRIKEGSKLKYQRKREEAQRKLARKGSVVDTNQVKNTVGFLVRVHEAKNATKSVKMQLKALGVPNKYDAVFIKLDQQMLANLRGLDNYVAYGFIPEQSVYDLIHRHAYIQGKVGVDGEGAKLSNKGALQGRIPLNNNTIVEEHLGQYGLICLEDLVQEVYNLGPNFSQIVSFLLPFSLSQPVSTFEKNVLKVKEDAGGFKADGMDAFVSRIV